MVADALTSVPDWQALPREQQSCLFWAAVLHDAGKPAVTKYEEGGRIPSRGHSWIGDSIARELLWHAHSPFESREAVSGIIAHHQLPFWLFERPDSVRLAIETSSRCHTDLLHRHARADALGRKCRDQKAVLEIVSLAEMTFQAAECLADPFPFFNDESRLAFFETVIRVTRRKMTSNAPSRLCLACLVREMAHGSRTLPKPSFRQPRSHSR